MDVTPEWLLSNMELSRIRWKNGDHDGELIVDNSYWEEDSLELSVQREALESSSESIPMPRGSVSDVC